MALPLRPLVSVILPTRSRPHLLPRAVASVFAQTWTEFEVLVVDDSPESEKRVTREVLQPWLNDPRLRYLPHAHPVNASAARNVGLSEALGEWITFLDDDDAYAPRKLEAQFLLAEASGSPLVLCGARYHLAGRQRNRHCDRTGYRDQALLMDAQSGTPFIFHRRIPSVSFDESLFASEDADYFLQLVRAFNLKIVPSVPEPLVEVYPQPGYNRVNVRGAAQRHALRVICIRHGGLFGRAAKRHWIARADLLRCRWQSVGVRTLWRATRRLLAVGGRSEARFVFNTWLLKVPGLRRFLVN